MRAFQSIKNSSMQLCKRGFLSAMVLAMMLAFVLMSGYACTPTEEGNANGDQQQTATTPNSGGFTLEDEVTVDVDIKD